MKKCIIFGCGKNGRAAFEKLKLFYDIECWADNDETKWGSWVKEVPVIEPERIQEYAQNDELDIFICMYDYQEAYKQLKAMGIQNVYVWKGGFFYKPEGLFPLEFPRLNYHKKTQKNEGLHVLFVSNAAAIRDNKIASVVKKAGVKVYLAFIEEDPRIASPEFVDMYEEIYPIMSIRELYDFVKNSEFDIVHCSSEPEYTAAVLKNTDKPIILDCHDLRSSYQKMNHDKLTLEFLSHRGATGVIYPTEGLREETIRKYDINREDTLVIENYPSSDLCVLEKKEKLSCIDGELHAVYEGGIISNNNTECNKYFQDIWLKIVNAGVHVHFYSQADVKYCRYLESLHPYLHYEGNMSSKELASELTKYDVGLCVFNNNPKHQLYADNSSPLKLCEYINSQIPVAVGNVNSHITFLRKYRCGDCLDLEKDIKRQLCTIANIKIPENILEKNKLTIDSKIEQILEFYDRAIKKKRGAK
ncbi:MAG: glycosyltransferase [Lachnospiraceae bacterium]|nr:glycosyltransferase [Lachnospiraceae bacterium]